MGIRFENFTNSQVVLIEGNFKPPFQVHHHDRDGGHAMFEFENKYHALVKYIELVAHEAKLTLEQAEFDLKCLKESRVDYVIQPVVQLNGFSHGI